MPRSMQGMLRLTNTRLVAAEVDVMLKATVALYDRAALLAETRREHIAKLVANKADALVVTSRLRDAARMINTVADDVQAAMGGLTR